MLQLMSQYLFDVLLQTNVVNFMFKLLQNVAVCCILCHNKDNVMM